MIGQEKLAALFPRCRQLLEPSTWRKLVRFVGPDIEPDRFPGLLQRYSAEVNAPAYMADLARLENGFRRAGETGRNLEEPVDEVLVNPTVQLLELSWKHLPLFFRGEREERRIRPEPGTEWVVVWRSARTGEIRVTPASDSALLALKVVVEKVDPRDAAKGAGQSPAKVETALSRAIHDEILLAPPSQIRRDPREFIPQELDEEFLSSPVFTLQWHVTQACDLHCKHCYDRTDIQPLEPANGIKILDDFYEFCRGRHVSGQVSFSGGNPLLYPHLNQLYAAAAERGLGTAILGNPAPRERIRELTAIQRPSFYQVSLEGLRETNDHIRGSGHYDRTLAFLQVLQDLDIYSMVMLTLTRDNLHQVLPLAERLRGRVDSFTFNRLSLVGEGASLEPADREEFEPFLKAYTDSARENPVIGLKDNLINILRHRNGGPFFGGCTGYGCGAAFNFVAVLPNGDVHACRKFPSPLGNLLERSLSEIYDSETAHRYRSGSRACRSCPLRVVCRGCLAVTYSHGLDVFEDRDPYCFLDR